MKFIYYNIITGEVTSWGMCSEADYPNQHFAGHLKMPFEGDPRSVWMNFETMTLTPKSEAPDFDKEDLSIANGDVAVCAPLPPGTKVSINEGPWETVMDGSLEVECDVPGVYKVRIRAVSLFPKEVTLNAY